jgi:uncharacterized NAD-dependent epimerase/dehydratase family protein
LELACGGSAGAIFVVGTGKGVGKTTALRAIYETAWRSGRRVALAAVGPTPPLWLRPGTHFVTARSFLSRSPASAIVAGSRLTSAAGELLFARSVHAGWHELIGPSTASGLREVVERLLAISDVVLVDGAIDRVAALAGSQGSVVVAGGAAAAKTLPEAVTEIAGLCARLRIAAYDASADALAVEGALTATRVGELIAARDERQIVVGDATQIVMGAAALLHALSRLKIRCRRSLRVAAATVCCVAAERSFDPQAFLRGVAEATGLPAFDVFAGSEAA